MALLAPFQSVLDQWKSRDIRVMKADWTTNLQRHVGAQVEYKGGLCYAKLAVAKQGDLDESDMLQGMRREVWWSQVIRKLRDEDYEFPFTSPRVLETNVNQQPFNDEVSWVIMEFIDGQPIVDWEPERTTRQMGSAEEERFNRLFDVVIASLLALQKVHPHMLDELGLPPLPSPPHGMRRWQKKGMLDMRTAVLGNGAFEIKIFWRTPDGRFVLMDNEFAGWYPRYDHLSYLYHRLYCNTMRPDLAKRLLKTYFDRRVDEVMGNADGDASALLVELWDNFPPILKPRVLGGWYYDTVRRKLMPWHKKQRLRYGLLWHLWHRNYHELMNS